MPSYQSTVTLIIDGNNIEATNKEVYINKLQDQYKELYNLDIDDSEISNITVSE